MTWQYTDAECRVWKETAHWGSSSAVVEFSRETLDGCDPTVELGPGSIIEMSGLISISTLQAILARAEQWLKHGGRPPESPDEAPTTERDPGRRVIGTCAECAECRSYNETVGRCHNYKALRDAREYVQLSFGCIHWRAR